MPTSLEIHVQKVENANNLRDWKKKITDRLAASYDTNNLKVDSVVGLSLEYLQDYHNAMHLGHLTADNRLPTDEDIQDMADIVLAILVEYEVVSPFGSAEQQRKEFFEKLKSKC